MLYLAVLTLASATSEVSVTDLDIGSRNLHEHNSKKWLIFLALHNYWDHLKPIGNFGQKNKKTILDLCVCVLFWVSFISILILTFRVYHKTYSYVLSFVKWQISVGTSKSVQVWYPALVSWCIRNIFTVLSFFPLHNTYKQ